MASEPTTSSPHPSAAHSRLAKCGLTILALTAAGIAVLSISWRAWPDVQTDFGRELYVPWRIAQHGEVLYRDLAYFNGPLSAHVNALAFRAFGTGLMTLAWLNIVFTGVLTALIYAVLRGVASRLAAAIAALTFVLVFACGQLVAIGNYNFICPYSHELTHGIVLAFAGMAALFQFQATGKRVFLALAGLALGLTLLTKVEVSAAAAVALSMGVALTLRTERASVRSALRGGLTFAASVLVPPLAAFLFLSTAMPATDALRGTLGSWWYAFDDRLRAMPFFRTGMGTDDLGRSARDIALWTGAYLLIFAPAALAALLGGRSRRVAIALAPAGFLIVAATLALLVRADDALVWMECLRPLPVVLTLSAVVLCIALLRRRSETAQRNAIVRRLVLVVFAAILLGKILLAAKAYHYGFALAMPATLVLVVALLDWAPAVIQRLRGSRGVFRAAALAALAVFISAHVHRSMQWFGARTVTVGQGHDAFREREIGEPFEIMRREINARVAPNETLFALPEGIMLNYLCRRAVPTSYLNAMPAELIYFGEARIAAALVDRPPDFIALVHKDTSEYGPRYFGRDYATGIGRWMGESYHAVRLIGAVPFTDVYFGILLLERARP